MVIRTIVQGKLPETTEYVGKCSNCKTEIECIQSDTKQNNGYDPRGTMDQRDAHLRYAECPLCHRDILVKEKPDPVIPNDYNGQR